MRDKEILTWYSIGMCIGIAIGVIVTTINLLLTTNC